MAEAASAATEARAAEPAPAADPEARPLEVRSETRPLAPPGGNPRTAAARESEPLPSAGSSGTSPGGYVLPTLAALGVVLGILYGLKAVAAKLGGFSPARPTAAVEVLSRTAIGPKGHVLLLRVGGRVLVVGDSAAGGLRTLADVQDEEEVAELLRATTAAAAPGAGAGADFSSLLSALGKKPAPGGDPAPGADQPDPLAGVQARLKRLGGGA